MSLQVYLRAAKSRLTRPLEQAISRPVRIAIGNESADLDSCVSSIILGYIYSNDASSTAMICPVMNMDRRDLLLRKELLLLLQQVSIDADSLTFRDELADEIRRDNSVEFFLLDHNHYRIETLPHEAATARVTGIIDHHVDEGLYRSASPRVIRSCGSCTSLVIQHLKEWMQASELASKDQVAQLALSAIMIDTGRLSKETTLTDKQYFDILMTVVEFLQAESFRASASRNSLDQALSALETAKRDVTGLTVAQLIRRDYKEWDLADNGLWGISSITTSLEDILADHGATDAILEHARLRKLDVYIMMTKHGAKELLLYTHNEAKAHAVNLFEQKASEVLSLRVRNDAGLQSRMSTFQQLNTKATRKKVAEICQDL